MADVFTLVGMKDVNFKGQDGSQVSGWNLFFTYDDPYITGVGVDKIFIGNKKFGEVSYMPEIGSKCRLLYNKYGKVADIVKV